MKLNKSEIIKSNIIKFIILAIIALQFNCLMAKESEDYDAIYKEIKHEYILNEDGSSEYNYSQKVQLFSSFAVNRAYGETFIDYDPKWQKLTVGKSVTTMAGGQVVSSPFNAYNEVLPRFASGAAPYLGLREMVVTHTGLEKNCTIDLEYKIETKKGFLPGMAGKIVIGARDPIEKLDIVIKVPAGRQLSLNLTNTYSKLTKIKEGKFDVYSWTFADLPLVAVESAQPPLEDFLPVLYFSTATKDEVISHLLGDKKLFDVDSDIKAEVNDLTADKFTIIDKSIALRDYVANNVGTMSGALQYIGYKPLEAREIFSRNVGSKLDKAVLLSAMCRQAGIKAYAAIASKNSAASDDIAVITQYENPLVLVFGGDNPVPIIMLDPNGRQDGLYPAKFLGVTLLPLVRDYSKTVRLYPKTDNSFAEFNCSMELDSTNLINGNASVTLSGSYIPSVSIKSNDDKIKQSIIGNGFDVELKDADFISQRPGVFSKDAEFTAKQPLEEAGGIIRIDLPYCPLGIETKHIPVIPAARTTPYKLPLKINEKESFIIRIPDNKKFSYVPDNIILKNDIGQLEILYNPDGNRLEISRHFIIYKEIINPKEYEMFYKLLSSRFDPMHRSFYIE